MPPRSLQPVLTALREARLERGALIILSSDRKSARSHIHTWWEIDKPTQWNENIISRGYIKIIP